MWPHRRIRRNECSQCSPRFLRAKRACSLCPVRWNRQRWRWCRSRKWRSPISQVCSISSFFLLRWGTLCDWCNILRRLSQKAYARKRQLRWKIQRKVCQRSTIWWGSLFWWRRTIRGFGTGKCVKRRWMNRWWWRERFLAKCVPVFFSCRSGTGVFIVLGTRVWPAIELVKLRITSFWCL